MHDITKLFKALSEEVRLRILGLLIHGELCVCYLMAALNLPQSTVSRHLTYLVNAGWLEGERRGVWMYYRFSGKSDNLRRDLLAVLTTRLMEIPEVTRDHERLKEYLRTKPTSACG
ncbi:MAG: winged helix-turn-helix transcriptional regulator [Deltaproteobacteria bacterium]|nr:winged helix-turn-helix transcriptional regulator [Deltaproteobacteria bacterium]